MLIKTSVGQFSFTSELQALNYSEISLKTRYELNIDGTVLLWVFERADNRVNPKQRDSIELCRLRKAPVRDKRQQGLYKTSQRMYPRLSFLNMTIFEPLKHIKRLKFSENQG